MVYNKLTLINKETVISQALLDHMQDGIYRNSVVSIKAVLTSTEMDEIIEGATFEDVGSFYMYLGETTASYKRGAVYRIGGE